MIGDREPAAAPLGRHLWWRLAALVGIVIVMAVFAQRHGLGHWISREALTRWLSPWGPWAPVAFGLLFALAMVCFIPSTPLVLAAGGLFGFWGGLAVSLVAAVAGAVGCFVAARGFGRRALEARFGSRMRRFDAELARNGFVAVLLIRLSNLFPFAIASYAAGLSRLRFRDFVGGTALGIVPAVAAYAYMGASLVAWKPRQVALGLAAIASLSALSFWLMKRRDRTPPARAGADLNGPNSP